MILCWPYGINDHCRVPFEEKHMSDGMMVPTEPLWTANASSHLRSTWATWHCEPVPMR